MLGREEQKESRIGEREKDEGDGWHLVTPLIPLILNFKYNQNSISKDVSHYPTSTMSLNEIMAYKKKLSSLSNT